MDTMQVFFYALLCIMWNNAAKSGSILLARLREWIFQIRICKIARGLDIIEYGLSKFFVKVHMSFKLLTEISIIE